MGDVNFVIIISWGDAKHHTLFTAHLLLLSQSEICNKNSKWLYRRFCW